MGYTGEMGKYPIVYVTWEDHWSDNQSWTHIKKLRKKHEKDKAYIIESVGFLLNENDVSIMLGLSASSDEMIDGNIVILKKNIVERVNLWPSRVVGNS